LRILTSASAHRTDTWRGRQSPWIAAAIALLLGSAFVAARLKKFDGDASGFVVAGDHFVDGALAPVGLRVFDNPTGYDGIHFYRLALAPFSNQATAFGITLDAPAYRQQRILYPLLAWGLSGGRPSRVPAALIGINLFGLAVIAALGAMLARRAGRHPLLGLVLAFYPGFVISLARDLSEITATAFVLGGLVLWQRSRFGTAALAFSLAVLARETTLFVPLGLALGSCFEAVRRRRDALVLLIPAAVYVGWQLWLWSRWGAFSVQQATGLDPPFAGLARFLASYIPPQTNVEIAYLASAAYLAGLIALTGCAVRWSQASRPLLAAWSMYGVLATTLAWTVWVEDIGFLRATTELAILSLVLLMISPLRFRAALPWAVAATGILCLAQASRRIGGL